MPKPALKFFPVDSVAWAEVSSGVHERLLARDPDGAGLTRLLRWDPGFDSSPLGPAVHAYVEEVYILAGSMYDLTLERTFGAGDYACRPPGMVPTPALTMSPCSAARSSTTMRATTPLRPRTVSRSS